VEALLLRITGDLPGFGRFLPVVGGTLLALGAGSALAERFRPGRILAAVAYRTLTLLIAALLLSMVGLSALQILLRNLFDEGLPWIDPLLRHLVLVLALAGALVATAGKRHVQINVLGRLLKGRAARIGGAAVAVVSAVICTWLGHASLTFLSEELAFGETVFLGLPAWVVALLFPTAFLAMAFQMFRLAFLELAGRAPVSEEQSAEDFRAAIDGSDDGDREAPGEGTP